MHTCMHIHTCLLYNVKPGNEATIWKPRETKKEGVEECAGTLVMDV